MEDKEKLEIIPDVDASEVSSEEEETKTPSEETRGEIIENGVILGLSLVALIVGLFIKNTNVNRWLYTLSFVFAGYEILYTTIVKLCKKTLVIEEITVLISSLIILYCGYGITACLIVLGYSAIRTIAKIAIYKSQSISENLAAGSEYETDLKIKERLAFRSQALKLIDDDFSSSPDKLISLICSVGVIVVAALIAFIAPVFSSSYGDALTEKWLPCGAAFAALAQVSVCAICKAVSRISAFINADRNGVVYGSLGALEFIADAKDVVFDKTGVVTDKTANITAVECDSPEIVISIVYACENGLNEELSSAISRYAKENGVKINDVVITDIQYNENRGIVAEVDGQKIAVGNKKMINETFGLTVTAASENSIIFVADAERLIGVIYLDYISKNNIGGVINELLLDLNKTTHLVSSDNVGAVDKTKTDLGIDKAVAGASTEYKAEYVKKLGAIYVGEGDYDKCVLKALNYDCITVAKPVAGENGASIAGEDIRELPVALKLAERTIKKVKSFKKLTVIAKAVTLISAIIFAALSPSFLWVSPIISLVCDCSLLAVAYDNLSEV